MTDLTSARAHMVDSQIRPNQVNDPRVITAMRTLPREKFAPAGALAYADADIDLGQGRTMLAPMVIARLLQLVLANNPTHVLVVGAGSGYGAAVLASAGVEVVALESEPRLNTGALAVFAPAVNYVTGPLARGWPGGGPYDVIFIEGAVTAIPDLLAAQLGPRGRVIAILSDSAAARGIGRAVVAEAVTGGFAMIKQFDCTGRILPEFQPAPVFSF
jgi:protein-L-isoaspartate(D-aspartate) O-methyltransferase